MKQIILSFAIMLTMMVAAAQPHRSANYEAANWKTWLLDNPQQIIIASPPVTVSSIKELQIIKERMNTLDKKKMQQIKYWDAGAPSYRWNQMAPELISWDKPDVVMRTPAAWMNIAIYDATILAWKEKVKYKRKRPS